MMKRKAFVILLGFALFFPASNLLAYPNSQSYRTTVSGYGHRYEYIYGSTASDRMISYLRAQEPHRYHDRGRNPFPQATPVRSPQPLQWDEEKQAKAVHTAAREEAENAGKASYTVQAGDTLYRIAKFFGTSVDLLMLENHITDPTTLQIGQILSIPAKDRKVDQWLDDNSAISKVFYATLTAYTAGYESTGKTPSHPAYGITASGAKVKENHTIAVDPDVIPLGSLVYIEGLGIRKAEDVGSAIKGKKIDVYIPDVEEALKFGVKKNVKVYVLGPDQNRKNEVRIASADR